MLVTLMITLGIASGCATTAQIIALPYMQQRWRIAVNAGIWCAWAALFFYVHGGIV